MAAESRSSQWPKVIAFVAALFALAALGATALTGPGLRQAPAAAGHTSLFGGAPVVLVPFAPMGEESRGVFVRVPAYEPLPPLHEPDGTEVRVWQVSTRACADRFKFIAAFGRSYTGDANDVSEQTFREHADKLALAEAVLAVIARHEARRFGVSVSWVEREWELYQLRRRSLFHMTAAEKLASEGGTPTLREIAEDNVLRRKLSAAMFVVQPPPDGRMRPWVGASEGTDKARAVREEQLRERALQNLMMQREQQLPRQLVTP